jgi:hypothetical protein
MKKILLLTVSVIFLLPPGKVGAEEFSLYGVRMGMTRTEVEQLWVKLDDGKYYVEDSILLNIKLDFDHEEKLYKLSFSLPVPLLDKYPASFVNTSFQELVQEKWANPSRALTVRVGRGNADITVLDKDRQSAFMNYINELMRLQLSTILKP